MWRRHSGNSNRRHDRRGLRSSRWSWRLLLGLEKLLHGALENRQPLQEGKEMSRASLICAITNRC